mmetsp:Transcript_135378/g.249038  ORF Transcript_135378/g.249038 Transcript_135378/m.249038 type:complete len:454 (-) Transcript_135378:66-1427(-)
MAPSIPINKYAAEFLGTFLLVFTVGCNVLSGNVVWGGVSIACMLMVAIYALGGISGANFNPAVSVTLGIVKSMGHKGGLDWATAGIYCIVQIIAGILAACCYSLLFNTPFNLAPAKGFNFISAGTCEMLYTFMLCFVVLNVAAANKCKTEENQWYGLAIGFVVVAGAYGAGAVSGGCFNPAVAIGIDTSSAGLGFGWCLVYMVAELLGAVLAALVFKVVRPGDFKDTSGQSELPQKLVSEMLGTFFLVLTVGLNVMGNSKAGAFSIAASLMCMIYALADVSGANFNPAVTLTLWCSDNLDIKTSGLYVLVQLVGGILAGITYTLVYHGHSFALAPQNKSSWGQVATAEIIFTFVLCFVVLCTAVTPPTKSKDMFGLAIGSCVTIGGFAIGGISGGSLNPAVSFGIAVSHLFDGGSLFAAIAYTFFECLGGVGAALFLKVTHTAEAKKDVELQA